MRLADPDVSKEYGGKGTPRARPLGLADGVAAKFVVRRTKTGDFFFEFPHRSGTTGSSRGRQVESPSQDTSDFRAVRVYVVVILHPSADGADT